MDFRRVDESAKADWDLWLAQFPQCSVYQAWEWGEHKKREGWGPERWVFGSSDDDEFAVCQFLVKKVTAGLRLVWAPGGPAVQASSVWTAGFTGALWKAARSGYRWTYFRCDPYETKQEPAEETDAGRAPLRRPWIFLNPGTSVCLDLKDTENEFVQGMVKNHRYRLRQALKAGLVWTHEKTTQNVRALAEILAEVGKIKSIGAASPQAEEMQALVDDLGNKSHLTVGYRDGQAVAGALCLLQGRRAWYSYAGSTPRGREVSASYAMVVEMANALRHLGARHLDFGGISLSEKKYAGVNDFKKGFGGQMVHFSGEWEAGSLAARLAGNMAVAWRRS